MFLLPFTPVFTKITAQYGLDHALQGQEAARMAQNR
jgi:hypothetical protein